MGGLHRKVSVMNVLAQPVGRDCITAEEDAAPQKRRPGGAATACTGGLPKLPEDQETQLWEELAKVDCGCCELSFRKCDPALPGLACLDIRLNSKRRPSLQWLFAGLERILNLGINFVATYDFRSQSPAPTFTQALAAFWKEHRDQSTQCLKSTALLVKDSIFDTASQRPISGFIQACALGCPFLVCHNEAAAHEFFKVGTTRPPQMQEEADLPFVSVVDVQEAPARATARQGRVAADPLTCIASLAPLRSSTGTRGAYKDAHTFHVLPNGDVRVIQSPPGDVVLRGDAWLRQGGGVRQPNSGVATEPPSTALDGAAAVAALKFECPREQLQQLIGTHFHLGELVIDAEIESASRSQSKRQGTSPRPPAASPAGAGQTGSGCLVGLNMLFTKMINLVMPLFLDDFEPKPFD
uniref:Uncharacterized protein n=1 Tax=Alexandrium catenella TaxID=2925 RepID=A0A7S1KY12_ALECA|mmetsp:Transcript_102700/g.273154  ORF Transcript_102700/g.273154 Transcript_102700/m.273154 type:complete len:411 (+) Transcript_102700:87-1319(+)